MDDAAVRVPAFARQMQSAGILVERHAEIGQPRDRGGRVFDHEFDRLAPVEPAAGDHRVADVIIEGIALVEHRGDPALCPGGRARIERAFGQHHDFAMFGQNQRSGQPGGPRPDDQNVMFVQGNAVPPGKRRCARLRPSR